MPRELACRSQRKASSLYRGVVRRNRPRFGRPYYWEASIERSGKQRSLGCYFDEEAAARAYDNAARKMGYKRFNFPRHSELQQEKHGSGRWYGDALKQAEQTVRERVSAGLPTSVFRGVSWQAHSQRPDHSGIWAAKIRCPTTNKLLCLGSFVDERAAAQAFDKAARRLRGHRAIVNFPNNQHETKMSHDKGSRCNQGDRHRSKHRKQRQRHEEEVVVEEVEEEEEEGVYPVESVLGVRRLRGAIEYEVKWVGYDNTTWEIEANMGSWWQERFKDCTKTLRATSIDLINDEERHDDDAQIVPQNAEEVCAICLDPLLEQDISETQCGHHFHVLCLSSWLRKGSTCPLCNARIVGRRLKKRRRNITVDSSSTVGDDPCNTS